ncbi:DsbA family protein [Archangium sp.]|uniref:DsbA family protein n=1 Tax=Archangium sp. TaxID=1872627 RepID=UPI0039C86417
MRRATGVIGLALVAVLPMLGCKERTQRPLPSNTVERMWVPLSATPLRGPATARVTLLLFCDFQSPYCARATERLGEVQREYKDTVRIQYRHKPLPLYPLSQLAAEASAAAGEQGQFWRYHDILFSRRDATPDRATLEGYAKELGLDLERFRDAIDSERARLLVDADIILAGQLGVRGAPVVFVNGRPLRGLTELAKLETVIEEESAGADALLAGGVPPRELYQKVAQAPVASGAPESQADSAPAPIAPPRGLDSKAVYKLPVDGAPSRGPKDAKVTVVLWSDFECGYKCSDFEPTLEALAAAHPRDVRIVWKFRPVPDHPDSMLASEAALAAAREGKFWQFHDRLFAEPGLERAKLEEHASKVGLDMTRFRQALDERTYAEQILADVDLSEKLFIANLPQLFINGRPQPRDAMSSEALEARVEEELETAKQLLKQGVPAEGLYASIIANGLERVPEPGLSELPPLPKGTYTVDIGDSPVRGPKDAPITIVTFSDFQCPYCTRLEKTLARLGERYGDKLRIVWKDAPNLEFHKEAMLAHQAARAAGEQGRFWEMHDQIFRRPYLLSRSMFERYAQELGLDMERFRATLDSGKFQDAIREEIAYGVSLAGPSGTPTVFINGRLIMGAYPYDVFRQIIDEELARIAASNPGTQSASRAP